jgi:apyrase
VLTVVAVPVLLVFCVYLLLPGKPHGPADFTRTRPFSRQHYESGAAGGAAPVLRFAVVVDAGSTGSRVHVLKFHERPGGLLDLQSDKFDQLKPGLSSFADSPRAAAASLKPLLELALATVPPELRAATPLMVGATAGLRLLPDGKADVILDEVRRWLRAYPFKFQDDDVKILSGVDEGAFAWLTLNYLLGKLGGPHSETVAAIDMGGGSIQEAFAMSDAEAAAAPKPDYVTALRGGGQQYKVYVYSYLGYGLMAGRAAVLSEDPNGPDDDSHPCVPKGHAGEYEYAGKTLPAVGHARGSDHGECAATVLAAMRHTDVCGAPQPQCTFGGAWGGPRLPAVFYISSYFWERAAEAGLVPDGDAIDAVVEPGHFLEAAKRACDLDLKTLGSRFPTVADPHRPYFCLDLTYAHTLLTRGFKIPEQQEVTLVKRVRYNGEDVEAAWPLGAAINALG